MRCGHIFSERWLLNLRNLPGGYKQHDRLVILLDLRARLRRCCPVKLRNVSYRNIFSGRRNILFAVPNRLYDPVRLADICCSLHNVFGGLLRD